MLYTILLAVYIFRLGSSHTKHHILSFPETSLFPNNLEMQNWTAITLANKKDITKAAAKLQDIYAKAPNWRLLTKRLPKVVFLNVSNKEMEKLVM